MSRSRPLRPHAVHILLVAFVSSGLICSGARAATDEKIHEAVDRAKAYLYERQQPDGRWSGKGINNGAGDGVTALAVFALLAAGEKPQDPRLAKSIAFLKTAKIENVYALGVRAQIWKYLPQDRDVRALINQDAEHLVNLIHMEGDARGLYHYPGTGQNTYDHSVSQYGVLGLWALAQDGAEIPGRVWDVMDAAWRAHQSAAGGWPYMLHSKTKGEDQDTISMTCAGVATLFITHDYAHAAEERGCKGNPKDSNIERGMKYMAEHIESMFGTPDARDVYARYYALFGIERIGVAAGYKYLGTVDWLASGSDFLTAHQNPDGSWGNEFDLFRENPQNVPATAFGILFLVNGNAPVIIDKLTYDSLPAGSNKPEPGWWNERPRDIFNLSHWIGAQTESAVRWHIVNLSTPVRELHEAPVLFVAGSQPIAIDDAGVAKLRQFVEEGGMLLGNADCGNKVFNDSFKELCSKMFHSYEFRELPEGHLIYTNEEYHGSKFLNKPRVLGITNGVRELALLIPDQDPSRSWQVPYQGILFPYALGADIIEYATERTGLSEKRANYLVDADPNVSTERSLVMARISYDGNWDPEPGGWRRMGAILHNVDKLDLKIDEVKLGTGKLSPGTYRLAVLTGTYVQKLTDDQRNEIKSYVNGGGTLLIDAAGGSADFADSMNSGLTAAFGAAADSLKQALPADDPIYPPHLMDTPIYRIYAKQVLGRTPSPRLRGIKVGDRVAVIFSREDLTNGLVGADVDGVIGYTPEAATHIVENIVLRAAGN